MHKLDSLPIHAWLMQWDRVTRSLYCGRGVETGADAWFEGVWGGEFEDWGFDRSPDVFGSGGKCQGDQVLLVTPCHSMESLFLLRRGDSHFASNSLAFLLTHSGSHLDPDRFDYADAFLDTLNGIGHLRFTIETDKEPVTVCAYFNILIAADGSVVYQEKPRLPAPKDYAEYVAHLRRVVKLTVANAQSAQRGYRFELLTTLSAGYDSTASAVLAREAGCTEGITFETALKLDGSRQIDDSGVEIGERLGIHMKAFPRRLPETGESSTFTQFYCDGGFGAESFWQPIGNELQGKLLISGMSANWSKRTTPLGIFEHPCCFGLGLGEFRRATGFAHLPVPFIMTPWLADIRRISFSDEMRPWSVDRDYDRPIPRRILEEAGIPGHLFGQVKSGNSFRAWYPDHWPAWMHAQYQERQGRSRRSLRGHLRYAAQMARYQILRFSCERRFIKYLANRLSPFGDGSAFVLPVLRALSSVLRVALKPFKPPHYKIIIRMHPRYTFLLIWANEDAARNYSLDEVHDQVNQDSCRGPAER